MKKLILKIEHDSGRGTIHSGHHELDTSACEATYEDKHIKVWVKSDDEKFEPVALYVVEGESAQIPGTNVFVPYQEFEGGTKIIELMVV